MRACSSSAPRQRDVDPSPPPPQSFDTVGWFARDAVTLERVGSALLARSAPGSKTPLTSWVFPVDLWDLASPTTGYALSHVLLDRLRGSESLLGSEPRAVDVGDPGGVGTAPEWLDSFRVLQAREVWTNHGDWVTQQRPQFGPGIKERFEMASQVTEAEAERAQGVRQQVGRSSAVRWSSNGWGRVRWRVAGRAGA